MLRQIAEFYADGFRRMTLGRTLWALIGVKLLIIFAVLKLFFFPAFLKGSEDEKADCVSDELTERLPH